MNETNTKKPSETDWARLDSRSDDMIDTSEIPPLSDDFFRKAQWWRPQSTVTITIPVESDVLEWFKAQGEDYERRMTAALRIYAEAHRIRVAPI